MLGKDDPLLSALLGPIGGASFPVGTPVAAPAAAPAPRQAWDWSGYLVDGATRPDAITGLDDGFESSLESLFSAAPPEVQSQLRILSGYRSVERQQQLWEEALAKYGSAEAADDWVAPPGRSQHNGGRAADLRYLDPAAREWVHANAGQYGLHFPLSNEPWHIEPIGARTGGGMASSASSSTGAGPAPAPAAPQGALERLFTPPRSDEAREDVEAMVGNGIELSQASGSPLLALLAPMAGAWAMRRAGGGQPAQAGPGNEALGALAQDERGRAALAILNNPNAPEWQRDLAEELLADSVSPSASSQRLTGQIEGADGVLYGQNERGELEAYTGPDGQPIRARERSSDNDRLVGQIEGQDGNLYGQDREGNLVPYRDPEGNPIPASRGGSGGSERITWRNATAAEARQHGYTSGQMGSNGQFRPTGRRLTGTETAQANPPPLPPEPALPSDPSLGVLTDEDQDLISKWTS